MPVTDKMAVCRKAFSGLVGKMKPWALGKQVDNINQYPYTNNQRRFETFANCKGFAMEGVVDVRQFSAGNYCLRRMERRHGRR